MKICSKCKIEKPFEAFWRDKDKIDGYVTDCKECYKNRNKELKINPLLQLEKTIRSYVILENNLLKKENKKLCTICKEVFLIDDIVCGFLCRECSIEKSKEYNEKNKEKAREYREKNKEKIKERMREYRLKNKEKINEARKEYLKEYRKKIKKKQESIKEGI